MLTLLYGPTLTSIYDDWENHSFDNMHLHWQTYISAFQYAVSVYQSFSWKEQVSFHFMAAVIVVSHFGAQESKVCHCFHFFPHLFAMK